MAVGWLWDGCGMAVGWLWDGCGMTRTHWPAPGTSFSIHSRIQYRTYSQTLRRVAMASLAGRRWLGGLGGSWTRCSSERHAPGLFQLARFGTNTPADQYPDSDSESSDYNSRPTTPWVRTVVSGVDLLRNAKYVDIHHRW